MTAVNCPMCELRFVTRTERDWHLRNEHRHHELHRPARAGGRPGGAGVPSPQPPEPPKD
jgi:hypothetical protein